MPFAASSNRHSPDLHATHAQLSYYTALHNRQLAVLLLVQDWHTSSLLFLRAARYGTDENFYQITIPILESRGNIQTTVKHFCISSKLSRLASLWTSSTIY
jgi:hypothetical protein